MTTNRIRPTAAQKREIDAAVWKLEGQWAAVLMSIQDVGDTLKTQFEEQRPGLGDEAQRAWVTAILQACFHGPKNI